MPGVRSRMPFILLIVSLHQRVFTALRRRQEVGDRSCGCWVASDCAVCLLICGSRILFENGIIFHL